MFPIQGNRMLEKGNPTKSEAKRPYSGVLLPSLLVVGAAGGFIFGGAFGHHWSSPEPLFWVGLVSLTGEIFLNLLKLVVIPLIVCSMIAGVASLGDVRKIGGMTAYTVIYYALTTFSAVALGLILVNVIQPGVGAESAAAGATVTVVKQTWFEALFDVIRTMVPPNLIQAAAEGSVLGLIVFSLFFGGLLTTLGERGRRVVELAETVNDALLRFVRIVIWFAPLGVFGLVAARIGQAGGGHAVQEELARLGKYFVTVLIGLAIHGGIVLPVILWLLARRNPVRYVGHYTEALLTAFSTASSAATLPLTMRCARQKAALSEQSAGFVLPIGATVNMDGTALYEAVAAIFIAQAYGIHLSGAQQVIVLLTATLAAVGAAAIPEAGLVTMVLVLQAAGLPIQGIGMLLSIDWLLDRFRTTVNVWGDCVGTAAVDARLGRFAHGMRSNSP
jgi:solute carrier family 1 (high affinity glutamate transporter) protein 1